MSSNLNVSKVFIIHSWLHICHVCPAHRRKTAETGVFSGDALTSRVVFTCGLFPWLLSAVWSLSRIEVVWLSQRVFGSEKSPLVLSLASLSWCDFLILWESVSKRAASSTLFSQHACKHPQIKAQSQHSNLLAMFSFQIQFSGLRSHTTRNILPSCHLLTALHSLTRL